MKIFAILYNRYIYRYFTKRKLNESGNNFRLGYSSELLNPQHFSIGDNFFTGPYCYFVTNKNNPIQIGNHVMFGPSCKIIGGDHNIHYNKNHMYFNQEIDHMHSKIVIEDGVWIGADTILLSGAHIGEGAVIGAMSLVRSSVPPYCIAVGIPAKKFRRRFDSPEDLIVMLQNIQSSYSFDDINAIYKGYNLEY